MLGYVQINIWIYTTPWPCNVFCVCNTKRTINLISLCCTRTNIFPWLIPWLIYYSWRGHSALCGTIMIQWYERIQLNTKECLHAKQSFFRPSLWFHFTTTWWHSTSICLLVWHPTGRWPFVHLALVSPQFLHRHMFTFFSRDWEQCRTWFKPPKHIMNRTDVCLAGVLQDCCVKTSLRRDELFDLAAVNVFWSGGILLDCASDFLKEQMVLFPN